MYYKNYLFFFSENHQCQSTNLLKPDSPANEHGDYLLTVNFLINYIDEPCITQGSQWQQMNHALFIDMSFHMVN